MKKSSDIIEELTQKTQARFEERQRMEAELLESEDIKLHYIFTLSLSEYPFLNLETTEEWYKYLNLNIDMFNWFFRCDISDYWVSDEDFNTEQFILKEIDNVSNVQMYKCCFEDVIFDACTNGKVFEIVLNPLDNNLDLDFSSADFHKLSKFFERWCGEVLVKSYKLNKYMSKHLYDTSIYDSIYESILELDFYSFTVYTYPSGLETTEIQNLIENRFSFFKGLLSDNVWATYGAAIRDRSRYYPPFKEYSIHIKGHVPNNYSYDTYHLLDMLCHHMNYWSMVKTLEGFMGTVSLFQGLEVYNLNVTVKKTDSFKKLFFGKEKEHTQLKILNEIKEMVHYFLKFGIESNHKGVEEDVSDTYILRNIAGEYFILFQNSDYFSDFHLLQRLLDNVDDKSIESLKGEYSEIMDDLKRRMYSIIDKTRELEGKYYQDYQLKHMETTQELTILSILSGIVIFLFSKFPFGSITQENIIMTVVQLYDLFFISLYEKIILILFKFIFILYY